MAPISGIELLLMMFMFCCVQDILAAVSDNIMSAVFMIDGELKDSSEALDAFGKKKKKPKASSKGINSGEVTTLSVGLYIPCVSLLSATALAHTYSI
jgi:hypothetical protein